MPDSDGHDLDEMRFFDPETNQYGYGVGCVADHDCGYWREMFRLPPHPRRVPAGVSTEPEGRS